MVTLQLHVQHVIVLTTRVSNFSQKLYTDGQCNGVVPNSVQLQTVLLLPG